MATQTREVIDKIRDLKAQLIETSEVLKERSSELKKTKEILSKTKSEHVLSLASDANIQLNLKNDDFLNEIRAIRDQIGSLTASQTESGNELSGDLKKVSEELVNVQETFITKIDGLINLAQKVKFPAFDTSPLEKETRNVIETLNRVEKTLDKEKLITSLKDSVDKTGKTIEKTIATNLRKKVRIDKRDITSLKSAFSNIIIPMPPPASPSFKNSSGSPERASVIRVSGVDAVAVVNPDGSSIGSSSGSGGDVNVDEWGGTATTLGQKTMAASVPVVVASNQSTLPVQGDVADNGVDSGNPVKIGAKYNSTFPTYADGDRADLQVDNRGNLKVTLIDTDSDIAAVIDDLVADDKSSFERGLVTNSRLMAYDGAAFDRLPGNSTDGLKVNLGTDNDVTVTGTVTANAGTNLNTSALALEAGGNLAAAATSLGTLDNIVSGSEAQVDVVAALPAGTNNIGDVDIASAIPAGTNNIGDVDVLSVVPGTAATNLGKAIDSSAGATDTGVAPLAIRDDALSTLTPVEGDYVPLRTGSLGDLWVSLATKLDSTNDQVAVEGEVAHDAAGTNVRPVSIGTTAIAHGTNPTAVAAADITNWYANRAGVPFVIGGHPNVITKNFQVTDADGAQTDADILGAIGAGAKVVVTSYEVTADHANSGDVSVRLGFGTATTPAADAAGVLMFHPGIAPGSGIVRGDGSGILGVGADGAELRVTCEDPVDGSVSITITYYTVDS